MPKRFNSQKQSSHLLVFSFVIGFIVSVLLTLLVGYLTSTTAKSLEREALFQQQRRAQDVAYQLDAYLLLSEQIAMTTATLLEHLHSQSEIESFLKKVLQSTSPSFVYGICAWFEPHYFKKNQIYFGPYVHRDLNSNQAVLTYEWSNPKYNYPNQPWYQLGKTAAKSPLFSEPYFDIDYVYMTTAKAFFDSKGKLAGVVSVDLILPQLREIINQANTSKSETIYVTKSNGTLLSHPMESQILQWAQTQGLQAKTLLEINLKQLQEFNTQVQDTPKQFNTIVPATKTGWNIHISTDSDYLFEAVRKFERSTLLAIFLLWGLLLSISFAVFRKNQAQNLTQELAATKTVEEALRETVRLRDEFIAIAAHELKTPLTPLLLKLQFMERESKTKKVIDPALFQTSLENLAQIIQLIDDLLDITRIQGERLTLNVIPTPMVELVKKLVEQNTFYLNKHQLKMDLPDYEILVNGDASRLNQVLSNLIENAVKYSPFGGEIIISLVNQKNTILLKVQDVGLGIPSDELPKVFERHYRSRFTPATSFAGLGLGLFIAKELVTLHGGKIWVESVIGKGSTFFVELPKSDFTPPLMGSRPLA